MAEIASLLMATPHGVGKPIDDRHAWDAIAQAPGFEEIVQNAERLRDEPMPELTDDLYQDFSKTGNRTRCQRVLSRRHGRVTQLALAECLENKGRFLPALEQAIRDVCREKTWVQPASDGSLRNFRGETIEIDLAVAGFSWEMATVYGWLGQRLSPDVRTLIQTELERRTLQPFESAVLKEEPRLWWVTTTNNWNAVCLAGVTGTALTMIESPQRRAFYVAAAEKHIRNFLNGFTTDGYCSEGLGYWNYGFGHFIYLAETLFQATGGKLDPMAAPSLEPIARFGQRMEILPDIYPAFADCHLGARPDLRCMAYLSRRFHMGLKDVERKGLGLAPGPTSSLFVLGLLGFPNSATQTPACEGSTPELELRDWFADAGILICRPTPQSPCRLGVALKGGRNAEHHNHNDVGSFVVAMGDATPLLDPGSEVYTARTFSSRRYESKVLNSFGHPVPRVAGQLQRPGRDAQVRVIETSFTDATDTFVQDLRSAYAVPGLKQLQRTFIYSREGTGSLQVIDQVEFESPQDFGVALITLSKWNKAPANRLLIGEGPQAVTVQIAMQGGQFHLNAEEIHEELPEGKTPIRLGIDATEPVKSAQIRLTITPQTP